MILQTFHYTFQICYCLPRYCDRKYKDPKYLEVKSYQSDLTSPFIGKGVMSTELLKYNKTYVVKQYSYTRSGNSQVIRHRYL